MKTETNHEKFAWLIRDVYSQPCEEMYVPSHLLGRRGEKLEIIGVSYPFIRVNGIITKDWLCSYKSILYQEPVDAWDYYDAEFEREWARLNRW